MVIDLSFAERIINKYKKFGRYHLDTPSLVLFDAVRQPFFTGWLKKIVCSGCIFLCRDKKTYKNRFRKRHIRFCPDRPS